MVDFISIIVPTFNRAHSISQCIDSVVEQHSGNWELLIIDDGSRDNTPEVVQPYLQDDRIKYYYQENKGVSAARNVGALMARGEYLIFLDSDDIIYPDLLKVLSEVSYKQFDIICWQVIRRINTKELLWKPQKLEPMYNGIIATFLAGSVCYNKKIFLGCGGYDPQIKFGENYELGLRIAQIKNLKIRVIDKPLSQYNLPSKRESNSISNRLDSYTYMYNKHRVIYERDPRSHSGINYLLGYIHEKSGLTNGAKGFYGASSRIYIWNFKAHIKRLYFKFLK